MLLGLGSLWNHMMLSMTSSRFECPAASFNCNAVPTQFWILAAHRPFHFEFDHTRHILGGSLSFGGEPEGQCREPVKGIKSINNCVMKAPTEAMKSVESEVCFLSRSFKHLKEHMRSKETTVPITWQPSLPCLHLPQVSTRPCRALGSSSHGSVNATRLRHDMTSHFHGHFTTMKLKGVQSVDGIHKNPQNLSKSPVLAFMLVWCDNMWHATQCHARRSSFVAIYKCMWRLCFHSLYGCGVHNSRRV